MMDAKAWRWWLETMGIRHGLWVLPGVAVLLFALSSWVWWVSAQEAVLQSSLAQLAQQGRASRSLPADAARSRPSLPDTGLSAQGAQRLFALAGENGLNIAQADYRRQDVGRAGRWQVQVPLTGSYPQIRRFLRAAQAIPGLSLDELTLRRAETGVEARLLFSIWYLGESAVLAPAGEGR